VVYERTDYVQNSPVLLASIWRLDLKSGDTWPVFQDRQLPGFAPRFSADGRWLSYISPSSQTLQVYQLGGDKHLSLPYRTGVPEIWSPAGDAFLYWDQTDTGRAHLNVYDMTTNRTTNLSGAADESDYSATWSPDGRWVAMTRGELTTSLQATNLEERVWLIRIDGTQARQLLGKDGEFIQDLQWSPDSRYLIYSRDANANATEIRFVDVQTGHDTLVMAGGRQPTWLP
jgi:Tol biopolymer transport system component